MVYADIVSRGIRYNERSCVISFFHDVTERNRAEEALRRSEERYELAVRGAGTGIWDYDIDRGKVFYSPRWKMLFGYSEDEIGDSLEDWVRLLHPDERDWILKVQEDFLASTSATIRVEYRLRHKDGSYHWIEAHGLAVRDAHGKAIRLVGSHGDITDRKRAEEALQASEERFRVSFEEAPVGMVIGVGDGIIAKANRALCRMSDYTQEELAGRHVRDLTHPDDRDLSGPFVKKLLAGEIPSFTLEKRYLRKDGQPLWAQATTSAVYGPDGKIAFALGVVEDITDRKRAEDALRQSERRFRNYFEQGLVGMAMTSLDKRWLEVNDRMCEIMGRSREELLQSTWADVTHPDDLEPNLILYKRFLAGEIEHYTMEKRFFRKDGSIVYATIHVRAFRKEDGSIDHLVSLTEDITAQKQAEEALRQSHDELQTIYDGMDDGLLIADIETQRFVQANAAMCRMLGYSEGELLLLSVKDLHPKADLPFVLEQFQGLAAGKLLVSAEVPVLRKDGSVYYAVVSSSRFIRAGRRCVVGFFRDVTERRQAEAALQREYRTLRHLLQSSDHERQVIAYEIHDELAQQLAGAIMQFQTYAYQKDKKPKEATRAFDAGMTMLQQGHSEAHRLISGVRPPILDEEGVVPAITHLVNDERRRKGPEIEFRSKVNFDRLVPILENAIYRIVQEGLTNACQHSQSMQVRISLLQRKDRVRIDIRDWGIGFDTKTAHENRFGLTGIRQRARLLGGKCSIRSKRGKGTRIRVELPVVERE